MACSDLGREATSGIGESTEHAVAMLQSLRRWLDAESLTVTPAVLDLAEWLPAWVSGRGTCRVTGSVRVRASLAALECVVDELLRNTATHGSGVASVSASAHPEHGLARIVIEDTGPGWPTDDPHELTKPFGASHRSDGRRGLGWPWCVASRSGWGRLCACSQPQEMALRAPVSSSSYP